MNERNFDYLFIGWANYLLSKLHLPWDSWLYLLLKWLWSSQLQFYAALLAAGLQLQLNYAAQKRPSIGIRFAVRKYSMWFMEMCFHIGNLYQHHTTRNVLVEDYRYCLLMFKLELCSWKTTSHKDLLEVCLPNSRLLSGLIGMWSSMKITQEV